MSAEKLGTVILTKNRYCQVEIVEKKVNCQICQQKIGTVKIFDKKQDCENCWEKIGIVKIGDKKETVKIVNKNKKSKLLIINKNCQNCWQNLWIDKIMLNKLSNDKSTRQRING